MMEASISDKHLCQRGSYRQNESPIESYQALIGTRLIVRSSRRMLLLENKQRDAEHVRVLYHLKKKNKHKIFHDYRLTCLIIKSYDGTSFFKQINCNYFFRTECK